MNQTFKKITCTTVLGATLLGVGSVEAFANDETYKTEGSTFKTTTTTSNQTIVHISDTKLLQAIRDELKKTTGDITQIDMEKLTRLSLEGDIKNLEGLEYAKNLKELRLTDTDIKDLSPIQDLTNLEKFYVMSTPISDLSALKNLTNLQELLIMGSFITDLTPIKNLTNLQLLALSSPYITDLSPIQNLSKLQQLVIAGTPISDLRPLSNLSNLKGLMLAATSVYDFSPLDSLKLNTLTLEEQTSSKTVQLKNNTLDNPFQLADGSYLKFKELPNEVTQSEDGSKISFQNPQKGHTYTLKTEIWFELDNGLTPRNNQQKGVTKYKATFITNLTIDGLMGEVNPILNVGEQTNDQKTITIDFSDSFYPIEHIILPDGTEVQGNQATFVVTETNDYVFKAYDSQGNEYIETQYVEIESTITPDEEDTSTDENKPNEENKPSIPEEDTPSDTNKPSTPDQPSVEPDQEESDKDEVIPSNPNEDNEKPSKPNDNQNSSNQSETNKPIQRPNVEAGLTSIGMIGLGLVSLISGAIYLKRKKK